MELLIYKASAGSGKTFTLAVEYIMHLIINPSAYRHILAVTFTNKATTEMKERILQQMWGIWQDDAASAPYLDALIKRLQETGHSFSTIDIRQRAGDALHRILHDYNRFQVTTIDSFFQTVTRNLARELGIGSNLNIELDNKAVLDEVVDHMIAQLDEHSIELSWILSYIDAKINDATRWQVDDELKSFGRHIFDEGFVEKSKRLHEQLKDSHIIKDYQQHLKLIKQEAIDGLAPYRQRFTDIMNEHRIFDTDLKYGSTVIGYFEKLNKDKFDDDKLPGKRIEEKLQNVDSWVNAKAKQKEQLASVVEQKLMPLLNEAETYRAQTVAISRSCDMGTRYLYQLQLINAIREAVTLENHEKNRFLLADTNQLLANLISDSDSAFIFEKIGTHITHIMIDEFQDTSRLQWSNFKPLVDEGLAQGADSLIVGDVKQSIYRWRNGDWNILNDMHDQETPHKIRIVPLSYNYRSKWHIIQFNNHLFEKMVENLNKQYREELDEDCLPLLHAYSDVKQLTKKETDEGYVKVSFIGKDEESDSYEDNTIRALGKEVTQLQQKGIPLNQMVILLRSKRQLGNIATWFDRELHIPVVSNEAFRLDASTAIHIIINALRCLSDPDDHIAEAALLTDYQQQVLHRDITDQHALLTAPITELLPAAFFERRKELQQMPLYELVEELFDIFSLQQIEQQDAYLFKFYDAVSEYLNDHSSELTAFLQYWDDKLCYQTIPSGEIDGIRIMTVHAAKGLEFHTVLVPFCDWTMTLDSQMEQLVWCSPQSAPYDALDMVPVRYSEKMLKSVFKDDFLRERLQLWVDNLNILYVALTRAEKNMIIFSNQDTKKGRISELLRISLHDIAAPLAASWQEEESVFEYGQLMGYQEEQQQTSQNILAQQPCSMNIQMVSHHPDIEFRESNRSADFIAGIDEAESSQRFMNRGSILHTLFASIRTKDDIEPAISNLIAEGIVGGVVSEQEIRDEVQRAFAHPAIQPWYDGTWQLFNECEIIWMTDNGLQQRRPDRVMLRGDEMVVVDFKFGKPKQSHRRQVQTYIDLLKRMSYRNITGYLWYVDENQIESV
ncbi:MAG: UvrD-helicase domain-containing protein [Bacteroidaceae bacterium]|nr:UvrD-helicase domain-containing protein [Bacteroidaceae bacterium]